MKQQNDNLAFKAEEFQNFDLSLDLDLSDFDAVDLQFNYCRDDYDMPLN